MKQKKKRKGWQYSKAKGLLYKAIVEGRVPDAMPWEEAYEQHKEEYDKERTEKSTGKQLFEDRLINLRKEIGECRRRANEDFNAFTIFKKNHRPSAKAHGGYPQWEGSTAQELLNKDIDEGKLFRIGKNGEQRIRVSPRDLRGTRDAYQEFPLRVFADHIKQELGTRKYYDTLRVKGKKKPHHWADKDKLEFENDDSSDDDVEDVEKVLQNLYLSS
jgi:hypothetical protein